MRATTVEILTNKGSFPPGVALAIAEAMDQSLANVELVTVPILDARVAKIDLRFAAIDARFEALEARMEARFAKMQTRLIFWMLGIVLGNSYLPPMAKAIVQSVQTLVSR